MTDLPATSHSSEITTVPLDEQRRDELALQAKQMPRADFMELVKERGWKTEEATRAQTLQRIEIIQDPLLKTLTWKTERLQGLAAMEVLLEASVRMHEHFADGDGRADLEAGNVRMLIDLEDGHLRFAVDPPETNDVAIKKVLAALFWYFVCKGVGEPIEQFVKLFHWDTK
jgi:hypothetical protein